MEFGFAFIPSGDYPSDIALVQYAEDLGFDYAWIPDQTFFPDPYVVMALIASKTKSIHIGLGVTNPYTRHPAMSARSVASVDLVAPGRIHLGIGAGNRKELLHPLGLDGSHAGAKCQEMAEIVRGLLSNQSFEYFGDHYQVDGIRMNFETRPDIPLYIAGRGAKVLQAAGNVADGVIIGALCTPKGISYALDQVRIGAQKSGRDLSDLRVVSWVSCQVTEQRNNVIEGIKPTVAHILGGAPLYVLEAIGLPMDRMKALKHVYIHEGITQAAELVTEECIDAVSIVGTAEEVIQRIRQLESAGVTQFVLLIYDGGLDHKRATVQDFAKAIFPAYSRPKI